MIKLAFLWNFDKAPIIYDYWRDGLRAAIEEIGKEHDVDIYLGVDCDSVEDEYDALLFWTDSNDPIIGKFTNYSGKKGIILTTDPQDIDNLKRLDTVFCESKPVYEAVRAHGIHAVKAFGTDTDFYKPNEEIKKNLEYFYPATFSPWKRQRDIAHLGKKLWCIGTVQPDGQEDLEACKATDVHIAEGYFKSEYIRDCYQRAKHVIIPAVHGSERTVLEAMATDILPEVTNPQNVRTRSYVDDYLNISVKDEEVNSPRQFVERFYNHRLYAQKIVGGLS